MSRKMTASEDKLMRARVSSILRSDACSRIAFAVSGTTITSASYLWAAHYINAGRINIILDPDMKEGAYYVANSNTLAFPNMNFGLHVWHQAAVVHECTHLWIDSTKRKTLALVNELCAYIAYGTFLKTLKIMPPDDVLFMHARLVAIHVIEGRDLNSRPASLDVNYLREAILSAPEHKKLAKTPNLDYGQDGV